MNPAYLILILALIFAAVSLGTNRVHPSLAVLFLVILHLFQLFPVGK